MITPNDHAGRGSRASSVKGARRFTGKMQPTLFAPQSLAQRGSLSDCAAIRDVLYQAMKDCSKSREEIADEMTWLTGREITVRMLNGYTAESQEDYRWPADLDRAFCFVTGDDRLLTCRAEAAGLHVIDEAGWKLLELGRNYLRQKRAVQDIASLERTLEGVEIG